MTQSTQLSNRDASRMANQRANLVVDPAGVVVALQSHSILLQH
jgi:hypothetical protein